MASDNVIEFGNWWLVHTHKHMYHHTQTLTAREREQSESNFGRSRLITFRRLYFKCVCVWCPFRWFYLTFFFQKLRLLKKNPHSKTCKFHYNQNRTTFKCLEFASREILVFLFYFRISLGLLYVGHPKIGVELMTWIPWKISLTSLRYLLSSNFFFLCFSSFLLLHLWALFIIQYACNAISLLCKLIFYFQFNFTHGHNECWMDCMKMAIENNLYSSALWVFSFWISILVCGKFFFFYFIFLLFSCVYMLSSFFTTLYYMWCEYVANAKESCVDTFKQTNCINTLYMRIRDWQKAKEKKKKLNSCVSNTQQAPNHIHSTNPWDFWQLERIRNEFRLRQHNQDTTRGHCRFCNSLQRIHFKLPIFWLFSIYFLKHFTFHNSYHLK